MALPHNNTVLLYTSGNHTPTPAQPAHAVDAATRPQDPSFFERWCRPEYFPDLSVAARLMGNPLDRPPSTPVPAFCVAM